MSVQSISSNEWTIYKLSELITLIGGGTPKTTNPEYWNGDIPWLSVKDFNNDSRYVYSTEKTITQLGLEASSTKLLEKDDIIISARGTVGEIAMIPFPMAFNQSCYGIRAKTDFCDSIFLYYLLKFNIRILKNNVHGSVFDTITRDTFDSLYVNLPPLPVQKIIASVLSSLDDKIELNTRMNKVLEDIARALFHRWFVEFEFPNAEGRPYKSSGGKMVGSEMGSVPEGWVVGTLGDIIELSYGKPLKEENRTGDGYPVFGSNGVVGWHKEWLVSGPGIIVGRKGNAGTVTWSSENFFPIDTTFYVVPKYGGYNFFYIYYLLKTLNLPYLSADSAVPGLNRNAALTQKIIIPDTYTIKSYEIAVSSLFSQIYFLELENRTLIEIRDLLLPKLMNGEIPLSENDHIPKKSNSQENK